MNVAEDHEVLRRIVANLKIDYPVALDADGQVFSKYAQGATIPLTLVVDSTGLVTYRHGNFEPGDEGMLLVAIERVLASSDRPSRPGSDAANDPGWPVEERAAAGDMGRAEWRPLERPRAPSSQVRISLETVQSSPHHEDLLER